MTTFWAPLLHIYQPPTQDVKILKQIDKECYKPLLSVLEKYDNAKFCLNINGILIEMLYEFGLIDTMELLKNLVSENKIEIVGTAKFHPILPLIPKKEAQHQIRMNEEINRTEFIGWERKGFFPPEMSISSKVAKFIRELGYKWILMSGIACPEDWPYDRIYTSPNGLQLYFRDDFISNRIAFNEIKAKDFIKEIVSLYKDKRFNFQNKTFIITALDGETFGHHIKNYEMTFLDKALEYSQTEDIKIVSISDLDKYFPTDKKKIIPKESSWSTTQEDLNLEIPYPLWNHPDNNIHKYYWKVVNNLNNLMNVVNNIDLSNDLDAENYYKTARYFYDRSLHSCPLWWANPNRGIWSPNLIYKGLELLIKAAINVQLALVYANKSELGEGYYDSISLYHGLILMEFYDISKKYLKRNEKN